MQISVTLDVPLTKTIKQTVEAYFDSKLKSKKISNVERIHYTVFDGSREVLSRVYEVGN